MSQNRSPYREKPSIDRDELRRTEEIKCRCAECWNEAIRLLAEDEQPGTPFREGRVIMIPVHGGRQGGSAQDAAARAEEEAALRTLAAAWFDDCAPE